MHIQEAAFFMFLLCFAIKKVWPVPAAAERSIEQFSAILGCGGGI